jgi:hypothetical protein
MTFIDCSPFAKVLRSRSCSQKQDTSSGFAVSLASRWQPALRSAESQCRLMHFSRKYFQQSRWKRRSELRLEHKFQRRISTRRSACTDEGARWVFLLGFADGRMGEGCPPKQFSLDRAKAPGCQRKTLHNGHLTRFSDPKSSSFQASKGRRSQDSSNARSNESESEKNAARQVRRPRTQAPVRWQIIKGLFCNFKDMDEW